MELAVHTIVSKVQLTLQHQHINFIHYAGCCFVKYATSEEADRAIRALHNQHTLPGGVGPIQVRYADGERERLGAVEYKLFVGSLNKQATEKEVEEIFSQYGRVEDVYLMRDEYRQSRGCGFVKYSHREMALAAINALNGVYTMRGCDQPLTVRFADPKRPRPNDSRDGVPAFGGPGFGPRFQAPGPRPPLNFGDPTGDRAPPSSWNPMSPQNLGPSNPGIRGFGNQMLPRPGDLAMPPNLVAPISGFGGPSNGPLPVPGPAVSSSSTSQQSINHPLPQIPSVGQQVSPLQKPIQSPQNPPSALQLHPQAQSSSFPQSQTSHASQLQNSVPAGQVPFSQTMPSQNLHGYSGQLPASQVQLQQNASSATAQQGPSNINLQPNPVSAARNQQQLHAPVQPQVLQPLQQSPSQLAQLLSQQTQTLQASFQSSQQAFSQLQQQLQLMQPSNQSLALPPSSQTTKQQWNGAPLQTVSSTPATTTSTVVHSTASAASVVPVVTQTVAPVKCNWTEHTSPDGYEYYYNSVTGESKWEKPEELTLFEQQQQKQSVQLPQSQAHPQLLSTQQAPQTQQVQLQVQLQTQLRNQPSLQQSFFPSQYPASGVGSQNVQELNRAQLPGAATSVNDPGRFQQASQELMWKNKPSGLDHSFS
ncbi:flowering time control protein FCA-like isoform X2 [Carica papaya]|uniref:flowering time control protein FCA-like isoform X2 n=1 Tax=Carica papaya TaxID=3649 RepID=UPI000B8C9700|nr:flowering time control protein FCA-like isoform X2 [Carica papaya]